MTIVEINYCVVRGVKEFLKISAAIVTQYNGMLKEVMNYANE
jgi:hypothetical protein